MAGQLGRSLWQRSFTALNPPLHLANDRIKSIVQIIEARFESDLYTKAEQRQFNPRYRLRVGVHDKVSKLFHSLHIRDALFHCGTDMLVPNLNTGIFCYFSLTDAYLAGQILYALLVVSLCIAKRCIMRNRNKYIVPLIALETAYQLLGFWRFVAVESPVPCNGRGYYNTVRAGVCLRLFIPQWWQLGFMQELPETAQDPLSKKAPKMVDIIKSGWDMTSLPFPASLFA